MQTADLARAVRVAVALTNKMKSEEWFKGAEVHHIHSDNTFAVRVLISSDWDFSKLKIREVQGIKVFPSHKDATEKNTRRFKPLVQTGVI